MLLLRRHFLLRRRPPAAFLRRLPLSLPFRLSLMLLPILIFVISHYFDDDTPLDYF